MSRFVKFNKLNLNLQSFRLNILEVSEIDVSDNKKKAENTDFQEETSSLLKNEIILLKPIMRKSHPTIMRKVYI